MPADAGDRGLDLQSWVLPHEPPDLASVESAPGERIVNVGQEERHPGGHVVDHRGRLGLELGRGELRHHPAQDFLANAGAPVLIDVPHFAAEWLWLGTAERIVRERSEASGSALSTYVSTINTDPWTLRV